MMMRLFTPDLYRNFAIGFVLGAMLIAGARVDEWSDQISSPAQAAEPFEALPASGDFPVPSHSGSLRR
jgi:hypothetical protein